MADSRNKNRISMVYNEPRNITAIRETLKASNTVITATVGARALAIARSPPQPDLIILDIMMPDIDGF